MAWANHRGKGPRRATGEINRHDVTTGAYLRALRRARIQDLRDGVASKPLPFYRDRPVDVPSRLSIIRQLGYSAEEESRIVENTHSRSFQDIARLVERFPSGYAGYKAPNIINAYCTAALGHVNGPIVSAFGAMLADRLSLDDTIANRAEDIAHVFAYLRRS